MTTDNLWVPNGGFRPKRYRPGGIGNWSGHLAFANDLIAEMKPNILVELGTHYGESYFGFCQSVAENNISCSCYAVDTWLGESHSGAYDEGVYQDVSAYNSAYYGSFSYLLKTTFDEAAASFSDESIDLLHIDGLHTYEAVSHDFEHWFSKVKPGGIVLLHDTMARHADFGVWKFWEELARSHDHFAFTHSWGLGVFRKPGPECPDSRLFTALFHSPAVYKDHIRKFYAISALTLACENECADRGPSAEGGRVLAQVYPFADGYSAENTIGHDLVADKWERFTVELPNGIGNGPLRFDPADRPALIDISALALRRPFDGEILWSANTRSELASLEVNGTLTRLKVDTNQEFSRFISFGSDPQLFLPRFDTAHFDQPLLLEVWLRIQTNVAAVLRLLREADEHNFQNTPVEAPSEDNSVTSERDGLLSERDSLRAEVDALLREREFVTRDRDRLQAERTKWNSERESMSTAHRKLHSELYVTRTDLSMANAELTAAREELKNLPECRAKCQELEQTLRGLLSSYSWRITAPVRDIMLFLRRRPRNQ